LGQKDNDIMQNMKAIELIDLAQKKLVYYATLRKNKSGKKTLN
jgi:hypothetical protein